MKYAILLIFLTGCYQVDGYADNVDSEVSPVEVIDTDPCTMLHSCGFMTDDVCYSSADRDDLKCKVAIYRLEQCLNKCGCNGCSVSVRTVDSHCDYDGLWI